MISIGRRKVLAYGATAAAAGLFAPHLARAAGTTLRVATPDSATHPNQDILLKFSGLVEERTKGAVKIKIFPDGQLGTIANALTGLQTGTIDMSISGASMAEGKIGRAHV